MREHYCELVEKEAGGGAAQFFVWIDVEAVARDNASLAVGKDFSYFFFIGWYVVGCGGRRLTFFF